MEETKVIYHIDDEETPYLVKLPISPDLVTLADFKNVLNRPNFKYFFKSMDDDFGVVKEEIIDDEAHLPCFNGRVVSWLVSSEGSNVSDSTSQCTDSIVHSDGRGAVPPTAAEARPVSYHHAVPHPPRPNVEDTTTCTETESIISSRRGRYNVQKTSPDHLKYIRYEKYNKYEAPQINGHAKHNSGHGYETSSMISSDLETTSFLDSEDDASSRITGTTEHSSVSRVHARHRRQRRRRHRMPPMSRTSSFSSITDSTMSLNIITVSLSMDTVNFLGISIVGQSNKGGDGGIYVGSIMKGGAVALDGRIEPGDMILQVNDINFENMSNDEAVRVLRDVVQKPGPVKLVVAKCWDPNPKGYFTIPRTEPVRPIDPGAWIAHTAAIRGDYPGRPPSVTTMTSTSSSIASTIPELERPFEELHLTVNTSMITIMRAMARPDSGLEIRDRMWLKITIPNAFIGADVVDWLFSHVEGFQDRREARKYSAQTLKAGHIRHTVNKITFSEQCYYIFGDLCTGLSNLKLHNHDDTISEVDQDTLAPLPPPATPSPWMGCSQMPYSGTYMPHAGGINAGGYAPMPFNYTNEPGFTYNRDGSLHSGSGGSSNSSGRPGDAQNPPPVKKPVSPLGPRSSGSESEGGGSGSQRSGCQSSGGSEQSAATTVASLRQRPLEQQVVPPEVSGSRQSFRMAMGNPCEFFVDVM